MGIVSIIGTEPSKTGGEKYCTKSAVSFRAFENLVRVIRAAWPKKTAACVAHLTGTNERTVQFWLAGNTRMSFDAVVALLKTEAGYDILNAIMDNDCKAEWWLVTQTAQDIRKSRKAIKREQERIAATRAQLDLLDK